MSFWRFFGGLLKWEIKDFSIKIYGPARARMECLYLTTKEPDLMECLELMEGLKRLLFYLAEKANHDWFKFLQLMVLDLGKGKSSRKMRRMYPILRSFCGYYIDNAENKG